MELQRGLGRTRKGKETSLGLIVPSCVLVFLSPYLAPGGPAGGVSVPVPSLVGLSRRSRLQEGVPEPARSGAQVAEGVRGRTHRGPLPVSNQVL